MNITYEKCGDYLIPNLIPDPEPERAEEVRIDAEILFGKPQERGLFMFAVIRRIKKASAHDTGTGGG